MSLCVADDGPARASCEGRLRDVRAIFRDEAVEVLFVGDFAVFVEFGRLRQAGRGVSSSDDMLRSKTFVSDNVKR